MLLRPSAAPCAEFISPPSVHMECALLVLVLMHLCTLCCRARMGQPSSEPPTAAAALNNVAAPTAAVPADAANPSPGPPCCRSLILHARLADAQAELSNPPLPPPIPWQTPYAHGCTSPVRGNRRVRAGSPGPMESMQPITARRDLGMAFDATAVADDLKQPNVEALAVLLQLSDESRAEAAALLSAPRSTSTEGNPRADAVVIAAAADHLPATSQSSPEREPLQATAAAVSDMPEPAMATARVEVAAPGVPPSACSHAGISLLGVALGRVSLRSLVLYGLETAACALEVSAFHHLLQPAPQAVISRQLSSA